MEADPKDILPSPTDSNGPLLPIRSLTLFLLLDRNREVLVEI
jgi:hypothetical protein